MKAMAFKHLTQKPAQFYKESQLSRSVRFENSRERKQTVKANNFYQALKLLEVPHLKLDKHVISPSRVLSKLTGFQISSLGKRKMASNQQNYANDTSRKTQVFKLNLEQRKGDIYSQTRKSFFIKSKKQSRNGNAKNIAGYALLPKPVELSKRMLTRQNPTVSKAGPFRRTHCHRQKDQQCFALQGWQFQGQQCE